jgi:hydroxymethylpyrimidine/phosphomethylpyrimidine kinase
MNLNQVTVAFDDYAASVAFYRALGLTQIVDSPDHYARFECPGGATFSIHKADAPVTRATVVYFEVDDVDAAVDRMQAGGLRFHQAPRDEPWGWREARLLDPASNEICIYHAGSYRRFPPWRVRVQKDGEAG